MFEFLGFTRFAFPQVGAESWCTDHAAAKSRRAATMQWNTIASTTRMRPHVIEAKILTGCAKGESVVITEIPMTASDCVIEIKRLQDPVKLSYAMTTNKEGKTLSVPGIDLRSLDFFQGQL